MPRLPASSRLSRNTPPVSAPCCRSAFATGGRAAEEVVYGDLTTGAESDIRQATSLARNMVGRFGMSEEIGFLAVLPQDGQAYPGYSEFSERTRQRWIGRNPCSSRCAAASSMSGRWVQARR